MSLLFILSILSLHWIFDFLLQTDKAVKEFLYATYNKNHSESSARWIESRNIFLSNIAECMLTINWINKSSIENILLTNYQFNNLERWTIKKETLYPTSSISLYPNLINLYN